MAILKAQTETSLGGFEIEELAPEGTYVATCLDLEDQYGVERKKYQSEEYEKTDVCRFLFGCHKDGSKYQVQTFEMKISNSPKSKLFKFLTDWLGEAPRVGFDTESLIGQGCILKIAHRTSQMGKVYPTIEKIDPVKTDLADYTSKVVPAEKYGYTRKPATPAPAPSADEPEFDDNIPF